MSLYQRMWDLDDLYAASELASELGMSRTAFANMVARHDDFPKELKTIGGRKVWSFNEVATWYLKLEEARQAA